MTLCIAHKNQQGIPYFLSDSRISYYNEDLKSNNILTNYAEKIFEIPIKVIGPTCEKTGKSEILLQKNFALCFSGNNLLGNMIASIFRDILAQLQFVNKNNVFQDLMNFAFELFKDVIKQTAKINPYDNNVQVWFGGFNQVKNDFEFYKFEADKKEHKSGVRKLKFDKTVLQMSSIDFIGERTAAKEFLGKKKLDVYKNCRILNTIIKNNKEYPTIGGAIQFGSFDNANNFHIYGIETYKYKKYRWTYRGYKLDIDKMKNSGIVILTNVLARDPNTIKRSLRNSFKK